MLTFNWPLRYLNLALLYLHFIFINLKDVYTTITIIINDFDQIIINSVELTYCQNLCYILSIHSFAHYNNIYTNFTDTILYILC